MTETRGLHSCRNAKTSKARRGAMSRLMLLLNPKFPPAADNTFSLPVNLLLLRHVMALAHVATKRPVREVYWFVNLPLHEPGEHW